MKQCIAGLASLLLLASCSGDIEPGRTETEPIIINGLSVVSVETGAAVSRRSLDGTVEAYDQSQILARLSGRVSQVLVREGDQVTAGDTLIKLDEQTATDQLLATQAEAKAAESRLAEAEAHHRLTRTTLQRYQQLHTERAVTPQEFDQIRTAEEAARQSVETAQAAVAGARARLATAQTMADQANISVPFAARISRILIDAGSTVMPGTPLIEVDRVGPWRVRTEVPENLAAAFQTGSHYTVTIPSAHLTAAAEVTEISAAANPATRTVTIKLALPDNAALKSGQFARIALPEDKKVSLQIPNEAIVTRGQLTAVYVVQNGSLHYRLVNLGATTDGQTEILAGLKAGERIVAKGVNRARHGAHVEE